MVKRKLSDTKEKNKKRELRARSLGKRPPSSHIRNSGLGRLRRESRRLPLRRGTDQYHSTYPVPAFLRLCYEEGSREYAEVI